MKKIIATAGATVLALSMSMSAMADVYSDDQDFGTAGFETDNSTAWNSAANGQYEITDGQSITFKFKSSGDGAAAYYGWVAEITDSASYCTVTQGATGWFAPAGCEWVSNVNNQISQTKSWEDDAAYAAAMVDADVTLVVSWSGQQFEFDSEAIGSDGETYTLKSTAVFETAPTGTLQVQVGSDHGKMTMYSAKYSDAEVEEATTVERVTLKPNMNAVGVGGSDSSDSESDDSNTTTIIIVVVAAVLVVAVVAGVVVATKKKKN
jgi:hypothetical protein